MATKAHHEAESDSINKDGKKITFNPRGLSIVWGGDSRYWRLPDKSENHDQPAELIQVSWLEVTASTPDLETGKKYKIYFELSLKPDAFGWNGCQVYLMGKIGRKGRYKWTKVSLKDQTATQGRSKVPSDEFTIEVPQNSSDDRKLYFGLYEVWSGKWKGGLQIHNAVVEEV